MKYFALIALFLFLGQPLSTSASPTDSAKAGMTGKAGAVRDGDSCNDCRHMHGGPVMSHEGMMCRDGHEGGMMVGGRDGMEGRGHGPMECGMMHRRGGMVRMIFGALFGLLLLTALVLFIMMEIHWLRLLALRVKAARLNDAAPKV